MARGLSDKHHAELQHTAHVLNYLAPDVENPVHAAAIAHCASTINRITQRADPAPAQTTAPAPPPAPASSAGTSEPKPTRTAEQRSASARKSNATRAANKLKMARTANNGEASDQQPAASNADSPTE